MGIIGLLLSIFVVIVIGGVFGADHQRVPITSNGPAAIRFPSQPFVAQKNKI